MITDSAEDTVNQMLTKGYHPWLVTAQKRPFWMLTGPADDFDGPVCREITPEELTVLRERGYSV